MPNLREIHERITKELQKLRPDQEIYWSRNKDENIESHRMLDKYEVLTLSAQDVKKLGRNDEGSSNSTVRVGDLIAMTRPRAMLEQEQRELKEKNDKLAKEMDAAERQKLRRAGVKDL